MPSRSTLQIRWVDRASALTRGALSAEPLVPSCRLLPEVMAKVLLNTVTSQVGALCCTQEKGAPAFLTFYRGPWGANSRPIRDTTRGISVQRATTPQKVSSINAPNRTVSASSNFDAMETCHGVLQRGRLKNLIPPSSSRVKGRHHNDHPISGRLS